MGRKVGEDWKIGGRDGERARDREKDIYISLSSVFPLFSLSLYIYIYRERERESR